jgi:hypothetical protein
MFHICRALDIEEGRAVSKSPHYKIWLFSFYFPARSFCRYQQNSAVRLLVVSRQRSKYFNNEY